MSTATQKSERLAYLLSPDNRMVVFPEGDWEIVETQKYDRGTVVIVVEPAAPGN